MPAGVRRQIRKSDDGEMSEMWFLVAHPELTVGSLIVRELEETLEETTE